MGTEHAAKTPRENTNHQPTTTQTEVQSDNFANLTPEKVLLLQRMVGNRVVQRMMDHAAAFQPNPAAQPDSARILRRTPRAELGPSTRSRARMLDWDAHHEQIDQDGTLREAFERNLTAQIERFFGSPMTQDQVTERIRQAEEAGNAEEAADLRRRLAHANQFAVVETLRVEESERYLPVGERGTASRRTYCNIYAYDVVTALGGYLPRVWWNDAALRRIRNGEEVQPVYDRTVHELNANALTDWMVGFGTEFGWRRAADLTEAQTAANDGSVVILLAARVNPHSAGHVNVVMPEIRAEDHVRDASGNAEVHEARRSSSGEVTRPMQSQAGGTNFEYEARSASWVTGETYRDGGAWIFGGSPQSPLLTPEQLGYSGTGGSTTPETPTQEPPVPGAEQPHTPESPAQPHTPGSPAQPQAPTSGGEQDWQARAVRMNERLSARLGWGTYTDQIVAHFQQQGWLEPNMSPAPAIFAGAVRQYQQQQSGLAVDGIIGRNTWRTLRRTLGIRPPAETPATPEAPGTTPESPSTPAHEAPSTPAHEAPNTPAHEAPSEPAGEVPAVEAGGNMGAAHPIPLRGLRGIDRQMARIHNDYGSYLAQKAAELGIMVADAAAFLKVESGGRGFDQESGRMIIRFENHLFYRNWGRSNRAAFDQHFRFNRGRGWTGHQFRSGADGEFQSVHSGQESEWTTFEFARGLDAQAAMLSISMGNAQILGSNYRLVGYRSVQEMFDDMSGSLQAQTEGLFTFIARRRGGIIVTALQNHNYRLAARYYNGTGQEEAYGDRIREASVAYARVTTETAEPSH